MRKLPTLGTAEHTRLVYCAQLGLQCALIINSLEADLFCTSTREELCAPCRLLMLLV